MVIGSIITVWTHLTGHEVPPAGDYIVLTAGLTGSGQYNNGLLSNESVGGSAPSVTATAQIAVGPLAGQTIRLINTENSFLRGGSSGSFEQDQFQDHTHSLSINIRGRNTDPKFSGPFNVTATSGAFFNVGNPITGVHGTIRQGTETRPKNVGITAYMRIQ